ncbi:protein arginine N-methyltransferase 6-like [Ptychodera flava]|uniref:protein arginine N-methyltransferase 6-like n=1 Tax=Ptychodera flava TaxID=63121 RepID=UPI003969CCFF
MASDQSAKRLKTSTDAEKFLEESYFRSYASTAVHAEMIYDTVRTNSYRLAILRSSDQIIGKVVADVGTGTGILSCFCVQAGAKRVYAIEASDIASAAEEVVRHNKFEDKIKIIRGKVEEVELPEKVDVIVSEWMGYCLLFESMLKSVIYTRDKWLVDGGIILPNMASIYLAPITCTSADYGGDSGDEDDIKWADPKTHDGIGCLLQDETDLWNSVKSYYGVDMSCMVKFSRENFLQKAQVHFVEGSQVLAHPYKIADIDISKVTLSELAEVSGTFNFRCFGQSKVHGFVGWFSVSFPCKNKVIIDTSPFHPLTHWQQTVFYLDKDEDVEQDTLISGDIVIKPNKCERYLDFILKYSFAGNNPTSKTYLMDDAPE